MYADRVPFYRQVEKKYLHNWWYSNDVEFRIIQHRNVYEPSNNRAIDADLSNGSTVQK